MQIQVMVCAGGLLAVFGLMMVFDRWWNPSDYARRGKYIGESFNWRNIGFGLFLLFLFLVYVIALSVSQGG